jgi:hypothetical protein
VFRSGLRRMLSGDSGSSACDEDNLDARSSLDLDDWPPAARGRAQRRPVTAGAPLPGLRQLLQQVNTLGLASIYPCTCRTLGTFACVLDDISMQCTHRRLL